MTASTVIATSPAGTGGARVLLGQALVAVCISALAIAVYDKTVRQPSTPRLAVVDIAKLYGEAERLATQRAIERQVAAGGADIAGTSAEFAGAARVAVDFGPALAQVLHTVSAECRCAIVAMAAVYDSESAVPDFTAEVSRRMQVVSLASQSNQVPGRAAP